MGLVLLLRVEMSAAYENNIQTSQKLNISLSFTWYSFRTVRYEIGAWQPNAKKGINNNITTFIVFQRY
jgi:hypothetical protein